MFCSALFRNCTETGVSLSYPCYVSPCFVLSLYAWWDWTGMRWRFQLQSVFCATHGDVFRVLKNQVSSRSELFRTKHERCARDARGCWRLCADLLLVMVSTCSFLPRSFVCCSLRRHSLSMVVHTIFVRMYKWCLAHAIVQCLSRGRHFLGG